MWEKGKSKADGEGLGVEEKWKSRGGVGCWPVLKKRRREVWNLGDLGEKLKVSEWGKDVPEAVKMIFSEAPLLTKVGSMFMSGG